MSYKTCQYHIHNGSKYRSPSLTSNAQKDLTISSIFNSPFDIIMKNMDDSGEKALNNKTQTGT